MLLLGSRHPPGPRRSHFGRFRWCAAAEARRASPAMRPPPRSHSAVSPCPPWCSLSCLRISCPPDQRQSGKGTSLRHARRIAFTAERLTLPIFPPNLGRAGSSFDDTRRSGGRRGAIVRSGAASRKPGKVLAPHAAADRPGEQSPCTSCTRDGRHRLALFRRRSPDDPVVVARPIGLGPLRGSRRRAPGGRSGGPLDMQPQSSANWISSSSSGAYFATISRIQLTTASVSVRNAKPVPPHVCRLKPKSHELTPTITLELNPP
jgi:hypothetical protein